MSSLPPHQQAGLPRTWEVGGEAFTVSGITYHQFAVLSDHLRSAIPHPVDLAKEEVARMGEVLDREDAKRIILAAHDQVVAGAWPPSFESPAGQRYYQGTPEGIAFFLHTVLTKHHPDLTLDEVKRRIAPKVTIPDFLRLQEAIEILGEEEVAARKARSAGADPGGSGAEDVALHTESDSGDDGDPKAPSTPSGA